MMVTRIPPLSLRRATLVAGFVCAVTIAAERTCSADDAPQLDLQAVLPEYIPNGINEGDFNQLKDNWEQWAKETGRLVADFYTSDDPEVRGRRATLERLRVKVDTLEKALNDPQYLSIYGTLADLHGRLSRRVAIAEAILETLEQDVTDVAVDRFQVSLTDVGGSARSLQSHLNEVVDGQKWVSYLRLEQIASAAQTPETLGLLKGVQDKLRNRHQYSNEQRQFLAREEIMNFENALGDSLALMQAAQAEDLQGRLVELSAELLDALEEYESEPTTENMEAVRNLYDDIRRSAPDGGAALTAAMRRHYLNYNLRVVIDESLMQDIVRDTRMESGFINEMISGARVTGCQWTNATVNLDLKPSDSGVRFDLILDGVIRSSAQGETHVATVFTNGRHCFTAQKSVYFDGDRFHHWCATIRVGGTSCPYAAQTCLSWAPVLGGITENIALDVAADRTPEANAYTLQKIRREVTSQFDRETGNLLAEAELGLQDQVAGPLRASGYYPDIKQFRSTETEMLMRTRLMEGGELAGSDTLPLPLDPTHGILIQIHESLLNQIGDRLELDGKRFTPEELKAYLEAEVSSITGKPADLGNILPDPPLEEAVEGEGRPDEDNQPDADQNRNDEPEGEKVEQIIFHDSDAARFQIRGGEVNLILSMGLKIEGREEIAPQRITVPIALDLAGDKIQITPGSIGVSPIGRVEPRERAQQIARAGVMRAKMEDTFESQAVENLFTFDVSEKKVTVRITDLRARGGWLSIIATDGIQETGDPAQPVMQATGRQNTLTR